MRGKYSPTVTAAYMKDRNWWYNYSSANKSSGEYVGFDPEGFDSYGYNADGYDRADNREDDYLYNDGDCDSGEDFNSAYDYALEVWGFDGTKPVLEKV